jgi:hypothetical protein
MAEEINRKLDEQSLMSKSVPYVCVTVSVLEEIMDELKESPYGKVVGVYEHARNLDLPESFKDELEFECMKRGYKSELKS